VTQPSVYEADENAKRSLLLEHIQRDSFRHNGNDHREPLANCPRCAVVALLARVLALEEALREVEQDADAVALQRDDYRARLHRINAAAKSDADLAPLAGLRDFLLRESVVAELPDALISVHPRFYALREAAEQVLGATEGISTSHPVLVALKKLRAALAAEEPPCPFCDGRGDIWTNWGGSRPIQCGHCHGTGLAALAAEEQA
jgi:hypothetical protein